MSDTRTEAERRAELRMLLVESAEVMVNSSDTRRRGRMVRAMTAGRFMVRLRR